MNALTKNELNKIESQEQDVDGYWIYLRNGYCNSLDPGTHAFIEDTKVKVIAQFRSGVAPYSCEQCK